MAMSRGKASVVAPVTNALAPVLTIVLSLLVYRTLPSGFQTAGIVLALLGSSAMVYSTEKQGEVFSGDVADGSPVPLAADRARPGGESTPTG
jgi:hypothetical protein